MKKNLLILLFSISAIIILIGIEVILERRIYRLETEKFDYRYREILQKNLDFLDRRYGDKGFQEAYKRLNSLSEAYYKVISGIEFDTVSFRKTVLEEFQKTLIKYQAIDELLRQYLNQVKEDSNFRSFFEITNLDLIKDGDYLPIYNARSDSGFAVRENLKIVRGQKPVYDYTFVGTNFQIRFNYFVDFRNKKAVVLSQVWGSLALAVLALLSVGLMFFVSIRSLMEERRLSQLKTDFINNMTHELKTPLSTISIAARTLENDSVLDNREKTKETVSVIHRQNRQLTKQINHLLAISMWERRQFSLERRMIEVEPFFMGIAEAFRWECKEKGCQLTEKYSIKSTTANLDEVQLTVAVHNLLVNGIKYNANEPELYIEVICDDRLKIIVTDNGIGIPKEDQKHIFDKFYRVSTGNIHKIKGLGLGLFYVKQIAEAHGGSVDVSSKQGKGSIFTINIPVHGKNQNTAG